MAILISAPVLNIKPQNVSDNSDVMKYYAGDSTKGIMLGHHLLNGTLHDNGNVIPLTLGYVIHEDGSVDWVALRSNGSFDVRSKGKPELEIEIRDIETVSIAIDYWLWSTANQYLKLGINCNK